MTVSLVREYPASKPTVSMLVTRKSNASDTTIVVETSECETKPSPCCMTIWPERPNRSGASAGSPGVTATGTTAVAGEPG